MTTYYVSDTNGDDGNDGESQASPLKTIGRAIAKANTEGDIVEIIDEATYNESTSTSLMRLEANNVTITHTGSFSLGRPKIDAGGASEAINLNSKTDITLNGLHITDIQSGGQVLLNNAGAGLTITDCFFENVPGLGSDHLVGTVSKPVRIKQSAFMFFGSGGSQINLTSNGVTEIENCFFSSSNVGGSIMRSYVTTATASFCTFIHQDYGPGSSFPVVWWGKVVNCVVTSSVTNANVTNITGIAANEHSNNLVDIRGAEFRNFANNSNASADSTDIINTAVTFVDGTSKGNTFSVVQNYALAEGSRGIDEGVTFNSIDVDIIGTSRPQGAGFDMGAFETIQAYWSAEGQQTETKFGQNGFEIRATKNRLATRSFPDQKDNRQAPYYVTIAGPPTLRGQTPGGKPYKNET